MKKILFIVAAVTLMSCTKEDVAPVNASIPPTVYYVGFRNYTSMSFNYADGCEANLVLSGVTRYLRCGTDTICSFKLDDDGVLSWKTRPGHIVTLGGCNIRSLSIYQ